MENRDGLRRPTAPQHNYSRQATISSIRSKQASIDPLTKTSIAKAQQTRLCGNETGPYTVLDGRRGSLGHSLPLLQVQRAPSSLCDSRRDSDDKEITYMSSLVLWGLLQQGQVKLLWAPSGFICFVLFGHQGRWSWCAFGERGTSWMTASTGCYFRP